MIFLNKKHEQCIDILKRISPPKNIEFNTGGKLIVCLIEFREMYREIELVLYALLRIYKSKDIGLAIVYGNKNRGGIEKQYSNWKNIQLRYHNHDNLTRGTYSALLKSPQFYELFLNWKNILIYQTDSYILRKIPESYFEYDYIGAPWIERNQWCKYNAGNGGFSLRNIRSCLRVTEENRKIEFLKIHRGNEDGFFCSQDSFKYPPINSEYHKAFSVERVNFPTPIGCHQIYHNWNCIGKDWENFLEYMRATLVRGEILDIPEPSKKVPIQKIPLPVSFEKKDTIPIKEVIDREHYLEPFAVTFTHKSKNRWIIKCIRNYEVLFCKNNDPNSVVKKHKVNSFFEACVHKKNSGCSYYEDNNYTYIIFYPGFPNGGECWADINANGHYNHCRDLPKNGAIILKAANKIEYNIINENINVDVHIGPFTALLTNTKTNRWVIKCKRDYEILLCKNNRPSSVVKTYSRGSFYNAIVHKKKSGCSYYEDGGYIYIIFYPGFPNGGESWADINADGHFNHCKLLPKRGAIILKSKLNDGEPIISEKNFIANHQLEQIKDNILVFDLFSGVGYHNQLFSFELAIYLAHISNRYLILNIRHPLSACGRPDRSYGLLTEYLDNSYLKFLKGFEVRTYENSLNISKDVEKNEIFMKEKMSSIIIVDEELNTKILKDDITEFSRHRTIHTQKVLKKLFDKNRKVVFYKKSNASRMITNFYTTKEQYQIMNNIMYSLRKNNKLIEDMVQNIIIDKEFISIHLRLGDWHKDINKIENTKIITNFSNWLEINNSQNLPIYIMSDKENKELKLRLKTWKLIFVDNFVTEEMKDRLSLVYKDTKMAEFLIQKKIIQKGKIFIGFQGSTISTYINYINYINNKPYEHCFISNCRSFNKVTLKHDHIKMGKYTWHKKDYMGGHPLCWSFFFEDNVYKLNEMDYKGMDTKMTVTSSNTIVKVPPQTKQNDSSPFMAIDIWLLHCNIKIISNNQKIDIAKIENPTIFLKTDLIPNYIDNLLAIQKSFILITSSNDDHCPPYLFFPYRNKKLKLKVDKLLQSRYLVFWYAKNPAIVHIKLKPYPLGPKWQWTTTQFFGENKQTHLEIYNKYGITPLRNMNNIELKKNLLYFNFTCQTTGNPLYKPHKNIRQQIKIELIKRFKWNKNQPFENYIKTLSTYKFCIAPPGRGIDSHRCWESLMVGTIPLVISSPINSLYEDLPVIIVNDWNKITEDFLKEQYTKILKKKYNFEKIYCNYWLEKLKF